MAGYRCFITQFNAGAAVLFNPAAPPRWGFSLAQQAALGATDVAFSKMSMTFGLNKAGTFQGTMLKRDASTPLQAFGLLDYAYRSIEPGRHALWVFREDVLVWAGIIWDVGGSTDNDAATVTAEEFPSYWSHLWWDWPWSSDATHNPEAPAGTLALGYYALLRTFNSMVAGQSHGVPLNFNHIVRPDALPGTPLDGLVFNFTAWSPRDSRDFMAMVHEVQATGAEFADVGKGFEWTTRYLMESGAEPAAKVDQLVLDSARQVSAALARTDIFGTGAYWTVWTPRAGLEKDITLGFGEGTAANLVSARWTVSARATATKLRVRGYGDRAAGFQEGYVTAYEDTHPEPAAWPLLMDTHSNANIRKVRDVAATLRRLAPIRTRPAANIDLTWRPQAGLPFGAVEVGDTVFVAIDDAFTKVAARMRAMEVTLEVDGPDETYTATMAPPEFGLTGAEAAAGGNPLPALTFTYTQSIAVLGDKYSLGFKVLGSPDPAPPFASGAGTLGEEERRLAWTNLIKAAPTTAPVYVTLDCYRVPPVFDPALPWWSISHCYSTKTETFNWPGPGHGGSLAPGRGIYPYYLKDDFDAEALAGSGITRAVFDLGLDDIQENVSPAQIGSGITTIMARCDAAGIDYRFFTLRPYPAGSIYHTSQVEVETTRQDVNTWMRAPANIPPAKLVDVDAVLRDTNDELDPAYAASNLLPALNPAGHQVVADAVIASGALQ